MSKPREFTDANFQSEVIDSDGVVLVDFWAAWCPPCRAIAPTIDELAEDFDGTVKVGKLDIDAHQQVPNQFGVSSIPAVLVFKEGEVVETLVGVQPKARYEQALEKVAI